MRSKSIRRSSVVARRRCHRSSWRGSCRPAETTAPEIADRRIRAHRASQGGYCTRLVQNLSRRVALRERVKELRRPIEVWLGGDAFPKGAQLVDASFGRIARNQSAIDSADRDAGYPVRMNAGLCECLVHSGLVGPERTAALQNQGDALKRKTSIRYGELRSDVNIHGMLPSLYPPRRSLKDYGRQSVVSAMMFVSVTTALSAVGDGRTARTSVPSLRPRPRPGRVRFRDPSSRATERTR